MTDVHHDRAALKDADTKQEKEQAQQKLQQDEGTLKKDWGPGEPKGAGEAHHGGGGRGGDHEGGHEGGGRGGGHGRGGHGGGGRGGRDND